MANQKGEDTVNAGPAPERERPGDRPDVTDNARRKDEDPSPDDRDRGEISSADAPDAVAAHDRAL
ncbi:hypothetical protein SH591_01875 [Sphingomonas sp. LY54]|uniref:hypothetical protein n=1 Tax=Sphingomonas sp. LY54 TaxID=3095343 RepID=UPI002D77E1E6|nr:hypothetical protein [Sphingomonas sp. LY54]WRP28956.1 hypothetical protein SH591_01875 [Sphingomonas sp. LY54]